jgi:hypothetical protein
MKRVFLFVWGVAMAGLLGRTALAGETEQDVTKYEFTDENVVGGLVGIEEVSITARPKGRERSLIRVRGHFVPEMLRAVEDL